MARTTGSCSGTSHEEEIKNRLLYVIKVEDRFATTFQYAMVDTEAKRAALGMNEALRITE